MPWKEQYSPLYALDEHGEEDLHHPYGWESIHLLEGDGRDTGYWVHPTHDATGLYAARHHTTPLCHQPLAAAKTFCEQLHHEVLRAQEPLLLAQSRALHDQWHGETCVEFYPPDVPLEALGDVRVHPCEEHLLEKTDWSSNIVVDSISTLLGGLFHGGNGYGGIQYVVVGEGQASWDANGTPAPIRAQTTFVQELARVPAVVTYLTTTNQLSPTPTGRLSIVGTFGTNVGVGDWREWGLVGGNATAAAGTGILIDYHTNDIVSKGNVVALRRVRFSF